MSETPPNVTLAIKKNITTVRHLIHIRCVRASRIEKRDYGAPWVGVTDR
jgi:hypothetical protein